MEPEIPSVHEPLTASDLPEVNVHDAAMAIPSGDATTPSNQTDIPASPKSDTHTVQQLDATPISHPESIPTDPISPAPSMILPTAPPTSPATPKSATPVTPKREVKLVTAGSSAADWFTHGFLGFASKNEPKDLKPKGSVFIKDEPINTEPSPSEKTDRPEADLAGFAEQSQPNRESNSAFVSANGANLTGHLPLTLLTDS